MKLILENASDILKEYLRQHEAEILKSTSITGVDFQYDDTGKGRWNQLVLASQGARLWSDRVNKNSPIYAGPLPTNPRQVELMLADLVYTKQQFDFFSKFGVTYIGRVNLDPRSLLVLDHKKPADRHDVTLSEPLDALLSASPKEWWGSMGIVSSGNVEKLETFVNVLIDAIPMVISTGAAAKMKFAGRDYVHLNDPKFTDTGKPDIHYGLDMRGLANDLSKKIALEESARINPNQVEPRVPSLEVPDELK